MYRFQGKSARAIARELHINRKTVDRYVSEYRRCAQNIKDPDDLTEVLGSKPKYDTSNRQCRVVKGKLKEFIDECIETNKNRIALGLRKQLIKKTIIHEELLNRGFKVSYSTVCSYIRRVKAISTTERKSSSEAFIRQRYIPGENVEFDWGEVKLRIRGRFFRFYIAVFAFSYSNGRWAYLFRHQDTLAFMESHRNFFRDIHGQPSKMIYDNMKVAVKEFVGDEKHPTEALCRMSSFYGFDYRFCNIRSGNEKGHVEKSVEYIRDRAFTLAIDFDSIDSAQQHLSKTCEILNEKESSIYTRDKSTKLQKDIDALKQYVGEMGCFELLKYKVDKWSTISVKNNHYSVPDNLVNKEVDVRLYSEKIVVKYNGQKVATHEKLLGSGDWSIKLEHYLNTMSRKPGSIGHSEALHQAPKEIQQLYQSQFKGHNKEFVMMLQYAYENGFEYNDIILAYNNLTTKGLKRVSAEQIKETLHYMHDSAMTESENRNPNDCQEAEILSNALSTLDILTNVISNTIES